MPIAAVAGGAGGGVVLLLVAGAICYYCRRNKARAQTQHRTKYSTGDAKNEPKGDTKSAKPTAASDGRGDFV